MLIAQITGEKLASREPGAEPVTQAVGGRALSALLPVPLPCSLALPLMLFPFSEAVEGYRVLPISLSQSLVKDLQGIRKLYSCQHNLRWI